MAKEAKPQTDSEKQAPAAVEPADPSKNRKKLLIIAALVIFVLEAVVCVFAVNHMRKKSDEDRARLSNPDSVATIEREKREALAPPVDSTKLVFSLEDLVVNPAGSNGKRVLSVSLLFQTQSESTAVTIKPREALIRDAVNSLYSAKTLEYLANVLNRDELRKETLKTVNQLLGGEPIVKVYFSSYVLQ